MAIKIGHASISENGTVKGNPGDSTGREVCTREWYPKGWDAVLRPISSTIAEKSAKACEDGCKNDNIGYSQPTRNTAHTEAKKVKYDLSKIKVKCNTDCSAYMTLCALAADVKELEYEKNAPTTSTMVKAFENTGKYKVLTDKKYLTSDAYLKRGDILVKEGSHTVMALENGSKVKTTTIIKPSSTSTSNSAYYPKCNKSYTTLTKALESVHIDSSKLTRAKIAAANGIKDYQFTAEQNNQMLILLKAGKLKKV